MAYLRTKIAIASDVGRAREHNEDYVVYCEPSDPQITAESGRLYIVADGVGGFSAGEIASEYAAQKVISYYYQNAGGNHAQRLKSAVAAANNGIVNYLQENPNQGRMATTLVAALLLNDRLLIANVGDSRAYLIRNRDIRQITSDHTLVAELVAQGAIEPEDAETHPRRNIVLRGLGAEPDVQADIFEEVLQPGDMLLLCSDGLIRHVNDQEIAMMSMANNPTKAVKVLVYLANLRGGTDNISLLLLAAEDQLANSPAISGGGECTSNPDLAAIMHHRLNTTQNR